MKKFFNNYEYFWEYEYPFGMDFLKYCFGSLYQRKYSLNGEGIFNLVLWENNKIYEIKLTKGTKMLENDGKLAFRDTNKDEIIHIICDKLDDIDIPFSINSGKFITFKYNNFIFKIEVIKKAAMPQ